MPLLHLWWAHLAWQVDNLKRLQLDQLIFLSFSTVKLAGGIFQLSYNVIPLCAEIKV